MNWDPQLLFQQAVSCHRNGQLEQAERLYQQLIAALPLSSEPRHMLGMLKLQQGQHQEALDLIGACLKINPDNADMLANYGKALTSLGRIEEAAAAFAKVLAIKPDFAGVPYNRALLLQQLGRLDEALASYNQLLAREPLLFGALHNRGSILIDLGRPADALADLDKAVKIRPDSVESWNNRGNALRALGRHDEALASFARALSIRPDFVQALYNRADLLHSWMGRSEEALQLYDKALALHPDFAACWNNRGVLLLDLKRFPEAMASFTKALTIQPDDAGTLQNRGNLAWKEFGDFAAAREDLERAVALNPYYPNLRGDLLYAKMNVGDWSDRAHDVAALDEGVRTGKAVVEPFIYQALSQSPADLQACSVIYAGRYPHQAGLHRPEKRRPGKIRIGYLSGEFRDQATAYLMAGLYECHDKTRFEIIAFDNGRSDGGAMRGRLEAAFDKFIDISGLPDHAAAKAIAAEEIDILVNLNGYFGERRMGVFAHKPASVQVNYLGFPGTLGAAYIDYIIADCCVIPMDERQYFTEKVVYLPASYQVNDSRRAIAAQTPSRAACGLPQLRSDSVGNGFVFASFNQSYKLTPDIFARWMAILNQTPGSVLWLLEGRPGLADNIRREAEARGVAGTRIIFAPLIALEKHLARLRLADLFLDTLPYNAHTTASDALWAGLPLVTCRGEAFAGRVAASLLAAVGLPELVTGNLDGYEALILKLTRDAALLNSFRLRLQQNRLTCPLFDTDRFRRNIEAAYTTMHEIAQRGEAPQSFSVEPETGQDVGL